VAVLVECITLDEADCQELQLHVDGQFIQIIPSGIKVLPHLPTVGTETQSNLCLFVVHIFSWTLIWRWSGCTH
jgi:hypothetical protein